MIVESSRRARARASVVLLFGIVVLALVRSPADAAIVTDATASAVSSTSVSSLSWNHTVATTNNRLLVVSVSVQGGATVSGVTYGGAALTFLGRHSCNRGSEDVELWYLIAPATGTAAVAVTLSSTGTVAGGSVSFSGVDQVTPLSGFGTGTCFASKQSSVSHTVASAAGSVVLDSVGISNESSITPGGSQSGLWVVHSGTGGAADTWLGGSTVPGAASVTTTWSFSTPSFPTVVGVSIKASTAPVLQLIKRVTSIVTYGPTPAPGATPTTVVPTPDPGSPANVLGTASPGGFYPGDVVTFTIYFNNVGLSSALGTTGGGPVFDDAISAPFVFVPGSMTFTCCANPATTIGANTSVSGSTLQWSMVSALPTPSPSGASAPIQGSFSYKVSVP